MNRDFNASERKQNKIKQKISLMEHVDMFIPLIKTLAYFSLGSSAAKKFRNMENLNLNIFIQYRRWMRIFNGIRN